MAVLSYLECDEIKTILTQQDINTPEGFRDHVLLTFMYSVFLQKSNFPLVFFT